MKNATLFGRSFLQRPNVAVGQGRQQTKSKNMEDYETLIDFLFAYMLPRILRTLICSRRKKIQDEMVE